jgi:hypothetical protein
MHSVLHAFTHSVVWASVIASVFVAAFVTLLIEYLAKPRLEARKERILEKGRERHKAINDFRRALNLANKLLAFKGHPPEMVSLMDDQIKRSLTDIVEHMFNAFEFIEVPQSISREWEYATSSMQAYSVTPSTLFPHAGDEFWPGFQDAFERMKDFHKLFKLSKWHPLRRRKLIRKIAATPAPSTFISARDR